MATFHTVVTRVPPIVVLSVVSFSVGEETVRLLDRLAHHPAPGSNGGRNGHRDSSLDEAVADQNSVVKRLKIRPRLEPHGPPQNQRNTLDRILMNQRDSLVNRLLGKWLTAVPERGGGEDFKAIG